MLLLDVKTYELYISVNNYKWIKAIPFRAMPRTTKPSEDEHSLSSTRTYRVMSVSAPSSTSATLHSTCTSKTNTIAISKILRAASVWNLPN